MEHLCYSYLRYGELFCHEYYHFVSESIQNNSAAAGQRSTYYEYSHWTSYNTPVQ